MKKILLYTILLLCLTYYVAGEDYQNYSILETLNGSVKAQLIDHNDNQTVFNIIEGGELFELEHVSGIDELIYNLDQLKALANTETDSGTPESISANKISLECSTIEGTLWTILITIIMITSLYSAFMNLINGSKNILLWIIILSITAYIISNNITYLNSVC